MSLSARRAWIWSLSARRAWIEIIEADKICKPPVKVALRKESVDRNNRFMRRLTPIFTSLSARRAWIEI